MKNKMRKSITLMLALTMLISVFATYPMVGSAAVPEDDKTQYKQLTTEQGQIAVEWESVVVNPANVALESTREASGRKHVKFLNTNTTKPAADAPGEAGFELTFDRKGKYSVWVRYVAVDGNTDSFWLDFGYEEWGTHERGYSNANMNGAHSENGTDYLWRRVGSVQADEGQKLKVRASGREAGCVVDKIIFTVVTSFTPEGTGKLPDSSDLYPVAKMPEDRYPIPTVTPTVGEHPRLLFKKEDVPRIKANMETSEMAPLVEFFNTNKEKEYSGILPDVEPNYDVAGLEIITAKALDYAFYGNEENGKQAISAIKNVAETTQIIDNTRATGHILKVIAQVYDWCYPLLSAKDKKILMSLAQMLSSDMEVGFPPDGQTILSGHGAETQLYRDWLALAIACYDEYPDAYNMVAGKVFSPESVDYRNWWNQSKTHSQGSHYPLQVRYKSELYAHILIKKMSGYELFNEDDLVGIAYDYIYRRRPDGALMVDGDDQYQNSNRRGIYAPQTSDVMFLASVISADPILKRDFFYGDGFNTLGMDYTAVTPIEKLILNDPSVSITTAMGTLPLTEYHPTPVGEMIARTGWDMGVKSPAVVATMTISEYNATNHTNYDCGHFMIYYKGILANDSGWYEMHNSEQHANYMAQSVAHNTLVIETPYNKWGNQNQGIDGPTKTDINTTKSKNFYWIPGSWEEFQTDEQNRWAEVMGHEYGPDLQYPEYSYLAGDIANAYTSDYDDGVNEALRHMIFLPTGNEKNPAAFVVFDKIDTKVGGNKKAFLLHSEEEPEVNGNITTIKRTQHGYNGKLVNQTLLPSADNLKIDKIGGVELDENGKVIPETDKRFWNRDQGWLFMQDSGLATGVNSSRRVNANGSLEAGWGRVEIMPKKSDKVDYMLNVMYVGNADDNSPVKKAELIETNTFVGAKIFDRVAMFNKAKARTKDTVTFVVPGNEEALKINVAGLEAGTWNVSVNGNDIGTQIASEDGGIIYFTAPAGSVTLTYASSDANKTFTQSPAPELEGVTLQFNGSFLYSDVPPTIRDGRTLIPMRAILEAMNAEVSWDEASATATANDGFTEIKITENQTTAYVNGEATQLDVPAQIIDGRFVIPVRFIAESFGSKVSWDESGQRVKISSPKGQQFLGIKNYIKIADSKMSGYNGYEGYEIMASHDGDMITYWSVQSGDQPEWGIYDFGKVKTLDKLMISYTQCDARSYKFDIEVSEDGVNFTPLLTGMETSTANPVGKFEEFDLKGANARYVRLLEHGNSVNMWNTLAEIVFTEKK